MAYFYGVNPDKAGSLKGECMYLVIAAAGFYRLYALRYL